MSAIRNDLDLYERNGAGWWDPRCRAFRSLRAIKQHHLALLQPLLAEREAPALVVDLGCGGGLLAVPLGGATRVVGIDRSGASLTAAAEAARRARASSRFVRADVLRAPLVAGCADLVLLSDVLEHVADPRAAVREAARLLRGGGLLFVNTINRTAWARFLAVTFAESVGLVPRGTHDPRMFVAPDELVAHARAAELELLHLEGEVPRILATLRSWAVHVRSSRSLRVGYNAVFRRIAA